MPPVNDVPPDLRHIDELHDMHILLSCAAIPAGFIVEIMLARSRLSTSEQAALKSYIKGLETNTLYVTDYIELDDRDVILIADCAGCPTENFAQT